MFVGREAELDALERAYGRDDFCFAAIYGRRRVGKTTLINEFCKNKKTVYFMAMESTRKENLSVLSEQILRALAPDAPRNPFSSFRDAVAYCFEKAENERIVLVLDEYPYLAESDRSASSVLQAAIDAHRAGSRLFLILCGSSMSFMERQVLGYQSPLYGRRTHQFKIFPLDYCACALLFPRFSDEDKITLYGVTGGVPEYASRIDPNLSVRDNIRELFFNPFGRLFEEPSNLLKQELRNPQTYSGIIAAIASGHSRLNEIASAAGLETGQCSNMLSTLISLGLVKKELPIVEPNPRKGIYALSDQMFRFWYRLVMPNLSRIAAGLGDAVCDEVFASRLSAFMGYAFEECAKQYMWRMLRGNALPVAFRDIGRWWGTNKKERRAEEIDFIAPGDNAAIFGECKWRNAPVGRDALDELMRKSEIPGGFAEKHYFLFSKSGFTPSLAQRAARAGNVRLVRLKDMFFD
ncbi:MAG: ATP-binding protein [Clostridiales Family XIII bacterium]|jgi:AAA+ ATPase superfamily predicted ATPase|nr:ATP-binding protein [Clostridiales Family XIII bacterium]